MDAAVVTVAAEKYGKVKVAVMVTITIYGCGYIVAYGYAVAEKLLVTVG